MNDESKNGADRDAKLKALRAPFPAHQISKLPKPYRKDAEKGRCPECGGWHGLPAAHLSYVGHAAITARLLDVDPEWTYEPLATDERGLPVLDEAGGLWIKLTVLGITRLGYGDATNRTGGDAVKERIGDALRNAAMRFGLALELWHKGDLYLDDENQSAPDGASEPAKTWSEADIDDAIAAMSEAATYDAVRAVFAAAWPAATEAQRARLQPAYEQHKTRVGNPPLGTPQPRSRNRKPPTTH